jgi:mRNA-degrading endonuclease RelE of RelBE toxin-antitoxin system
VARGADFAGLHSAPRGSCRVLYEIDDDTRVVNRIAHRGSAYRPRLRSKWLT